MRILLVEDHHDTGDVFARLLRAIGHQVQLAGRGSDALSLCAAEPFDLLISDLGLPDLSGWDLLVEIRKLQPRIPAIALSGFSQPDDFDRSVRAGFNLHLAKPVTLDQLVKAIDAIKRTPRRWLTRSVHLYRLASLYCHVACGTLNLRGRSGSTLVRRRKASSRFHRGGRHESGHGVRGRSQFGDRTGLRVRVRRK
jgi:CheY-like chemotaxis protein